MSGSVVVIGGSSGLGKAVAAHYAAQGREVYVTSRDQQRAEATAEEIGGNTKGIAVDISPSGQRSPRPWRASARSSTWWIGPPSSATRTPSATTPSTGP